jgi:hypothetical protein
VLTTPPYVTRKLAAGSDEPGGTLGKVLAEPRLSPQVAACLGEQLQEQYAQLMTDPVPDVLVQILEPLYRKRRSDLD